MSMIEKIRNRTSISDRIAEQIVFNSYMSSLNSYQAYEVRKSSLRLALYYGDWSDALDTYIQFVIIDDDSRKRLMYLKDTTQNPVREVVEKVSKVYNENVQRNFKNGSESDDNAEYAYSLMNMQQFCTELNIFYNLLNDAIVLVDWNYITNEPYLRILNRTNCDVVVNRYYPEIIEKLTIYVDSDLDSNADDQLNSFQLAADKRLFKYKIVWTNKEHYIEDFEGQKIGIPGRRLNTDYKNYYGIIPAVSVHKEKISGSFWNSFSNQELFDFMLNIGLKNSLDTLTYFFNSFKTGFVIGDEGAPGSWPDKFAITPGVFNKVSSIGGSGKVEVVDMMSDFDKLENYKQAGRKAVYDLFGISIELNAISSAQSGISLQIKNAQLQEARQKQIPNFSAFEKQFFNIFRLVWNFYRNEKINDNTIIQVFFPESEVFVSRIDKLNYYWAMYQRGLKSGGEFYQAFNPTVTDIVEAEKMFIENLTNFKQLFGEPAFNQDAPVDNNIQDTIE